MAVNPNDGLDYQSMPDDELMNYLVGMMGDMPGKTQAQKLNYYQDLVSTTGYDPIMSAGQQEADPNSGPFQPQYDSGPSLQRTAYAHNPVASQMFDLIDNGSDPISAFNATAKAAGLNFDQNTPDGKANYDQYSKIGTDYAFEKANEAKDHAKFDNDQLNAAAKSAQTYSDSQGKQYDSGKYKNAAPAGSGKNMWDTVSEYDAMGAPTTDDLLNELVGKGAFRRRAGKDNQVRDTDPFMTFSEFSKAKNDPSKQVGPTAPGSGWGSLKEALDTKSGDVTGHFAATPPGGRTQQDEYNTAKQLHDSKVSTKTVKGQQLIEGDWQTDNAVRMAVNKRLEKAKNTQLHSDAYNKSMQALDLARRMGL